MQMYSNYISPLGYQTNGGGIDSYGVNHSGFSLRDELQYQTARQQRENQLIQNYNNQGITENYPQYSTNFWGNNADNNYGFGNSNISANIENMQNNITPIPQATATPQQQTQQQAGTSAWDVVKQWGNNFADATEAGVVGYATGASLGNFDEAMGGAATALGVDYQGARDAVRQLQNNLSQQHPYVYGGAETLGAATTPMHFFKDPRYLFFSRQARNNLYNALTDTALATLGYADLNNSSDVIKNALSIGAGNVAGYKIGDHLLGRGIGNISRIGFNAAGNVLGDNIINWLYDKLK